MDDLTKLAARLGHAFADPARLEEALSHRSTGRRNYERLEFLGDGLLNFVVAAELYRRRPDDEEGSLSRLRASLVRESSLAAVARELALGEHLRLGGGELASGGFERDSILADAIESIVGAVFLDAGFEAARELVLRLLGPRLEDLPSGEALKDPKTRLQEHLQGRSLERPPLRGRRHPRQVARDALHGALHAAVAPGVGARDVDEPQEGRAAGRERGARQPRDAAAAARGALRAAPRRPRRRRPGAARTPARRRASRTAPPAFRGPAGGTYRGTYRSAGDATPGAS